MAYPSDALAERAAPPPHGGERPANLRGVPGARATWVRFGGWLAGGRHWHFALGWLLVLNGVLYLSYMVARGEWRRRLFLPQRNTMDALLMLAYYLL